MLHRFISFFDAFRRNPPPMVAVIRLAGVIGPGGRFRNALNLEGMRKTIASAFAIKGVKAVALAINSPGGSPVQSALIMQRIRDLAAEKDIPVLAFAEDVAASGGYMLALAGDEIYAHEASIMGSIGVVSSSFGFTEAIKKLGIERRLYTSGEKKALLDAFSPAKKEELARLMEIQSEIHDYFNSMGRERRGRKLKGTRAKIFSGDVWLGTEAKKLGLIDEIGELRTVLRERFGKQVRIRPVGLKKPGFFSLFGGRNEGRLSGFNAVGGGLWVNDFLEAIETRGFWDRFGL